MNPWEEVREETVPRKVGDETLKRSLRPEEFARNLKMARKASGLTVEALAARANIRVNALESYEVGKFWPPVVHAQILADALGTRIPVLLGVEESVPRGLTPDALGALTGHLEELETLQRSLEMARASEERWMNLAEAVVEGIVLHDGKTILDVNPRFAEMFGYDRRDILGRRIFEFIAEESMSDVVQHIASGSSEPYELVGLTKRGDKVRTRVQGRSLKNGQRVAAFEIVR